MIGLVLATARAEEPSAQDLYVGWGLYQAEQYDAAADMARARLETNPHDIASHRLFLYARRAAGQSASPRLFRNWLAEKEDSPERRIILAIAIASRYRSEGDWCEEVQGLLEPLPESEESRYWALRTLLGVQRSCEVDLESVERAMVELGGRYQEAEAYALMTRMKREPITGELLDAFTAMLEREPYRLLIARKLWGEPLVDKRGARKARKVALTVAEAALQSDDAPSIQAAMEVFEVDGADGLAADARTRLGLVDSRFVPPSLDNQEEDGEEEAGESLFRQISDANRKPTHELALSDLNALADSIPENGPEAAYYHGLRAERLSALGRTDGHCEALKKGWLAVSGMARPAQANAFAYDTALKCDHLPLALEAINRALETLSKEEYDPAAGAPLMAFLMDKRSSMSAYYDTRGWVLYRMERYEEAAEALRTALYFEVDSVQHAHLGLVYKAMNKPTLAFEHMSLALARGIPEDELGTEIQEAFAALYRDLGHWGPGGVEGYVESLRMPPRDADSAADDPRPRHELIGEIFPLEEYLTLKGDKVALREEEQVLVVDLWATWCGPCIQSMPHLQEVAKAYEDKGVRVLGLSVDTERREAVNFFRRTPSLSYDVGWIGEEGWEEFDGQGIPAMFILDKDNRVVEFVGGYGGSGNDTRLEAALDRMLSKE